MGAVSGELKFKLDLQNIKLEETNEVYSVQEIQHLLPHLNTCRNQ